MNVPSLDHIGGGLKPVPMVLGIWVLFVGLGKQTWSKPMVKGILPSPRDSHSCTTVGTNLFVFGGIDGKNSLRDLHMLDTSKF